MVTQNKPAPAQVLTGGTDLEKLVAEMERLKRENEGLKAKQAEKGKVSMKCKPVEVEEVDVIDKNGRKIGKEKKTKGGNLCIYGLQRFPFSFFSGQTTRLFQPKVVLEALKTQLADIANQRMNGDDEAESEQLRSEIKAEMEKLVGFYTEAIKLIGT